MVNQSSPGGFLLLGFSAHPRLERILFVVVLISYLLNSGGKHTHHPAVCAKPQAPLANVLFPLQSLLLGPLLHHKLCPPDAGQPLGAKEDHQLLGLLCSALHLPLPGDHRMRPPNSDGL